MVWIFLDKRIMRFPFSFATGVVIGLPIYITCKDYLCCIARVEGTSMQPTLNPRFETNCDVVLLNSWITDYENLKRGEIVAIASPYHSNVSYIKRIIGLEGDIVPTPRYKQSHVFIPKGHCWVEGDNKRSSLDSNSFGPVSIGLIKAKATHIIWPPHRWQKLSFNMPNSNSSSNDRTESIILEKKCPEGGVTKETNVNINTRYMVNEISKLEDK